MEIALVFSGTIMALMGLLTIGMTDGSPVKPLFVIVAGLAMVASAFFASPGRRLRGNGLKTAIGGISGLLAFAGFMTTLLAFMGLDLMTPLWLWRAGGVAALAGGFFGVFYAVNYRVNVYALKLGESLGFGPAETGLLGADGNYNVKKKFGDLEVLLDIDQRPERKHQPESYFIDILCRVRNPHGLRLAVYPESFLGLKRPFGLLPGVLKDVPGWGGCVKRGSPPAAAAALLAGAAGGLDAEFREANGFLCVRLGRSGLKLLFSHTGRPERGRVERAVKAALALAGLVDGRA